MVLASVLNLQIARRSMRTHMFRTRVKPEKLTLYKLHHQMVWKAVEEGLRAAGLTRLQIWAPKPDAAPSSDANCLQMLIETPDDVDLGQVTGENSSYWSSSPDVPKWEILMQSFFEAGEWVEMDVVYNLNPSTNVQGEEALEKLMANIAAEENEN